MKAEIAVLAMLIMALVFPALSSVCQNEIGQNGFSEDQNSRLSIMSADTKRLEERMTGALADMISKRSNPRDPELPGINQSNESTPINSSAANASAINSSATNASINSSATKVPTSIASADNPPALSSPTPALDDSAGQQGMGSSSNSRFLGNYGITSSQHQMGKSDIDSSTFLSGSFSMDKSVKFQDIGI